MTPSPSHRARWCELIDLHLLGIISREDAIELETALAAHREARDDFRLRCRLDAALRQEACAQPSAVLLRSAKPASGLTWRPLTAAAAGLVLGMFCTSMVFGFAALRPSVHKRPIPVFDPGFEGVNTLDTGIPHRSEEWGVRSAKVSKEDQGWPPREGSRMLRLEPVLGNEDDDNYSAGAFQVLDLSQMLRDKTSDSAEAEVTAAFATAGDDKARYIMRVVALDEPPDSATTDFWTKADKAEVVSMTQRFHAAESASGWQTHSVKIPLPSSARSLVIVITVLVPRNTSMPPSPHFLDDVQAYLIEHDGHSALP